MKQIIRFSVMLLALLLPALAMAHDFEVDGIYYNINVNEATVTKQRTSSSENNEYSGSIVIVIEQGTSSSENKYSGSIVIPETVTYRGTTYSVTSIGSHAFSSCHDLTSIVMVTLVKRVQRSNASSPIEVTELGIPNSVTSIGSYVFNQCSGLKDIYSYIDNLSLVSMDSSVFCLFSANYNKRTLHVPVGSLKAYQADSRWSEFFGNIVEMEP